MLQEVKGASMPPQAYKALRALVCSTAATHQPVGTYVQRGRCIDSACCLQDAQSILEEVYRAAPVPEEYMKYQLHLSTGMEVPQIELWFQNRRTTDGSSGAPAEGKTLHCSCYHAQQWCESYAHRPTGPLSAAAGCLGALQKEMWRAPTSLAWEWYQSCGFCLILGTEPTMTALGLPWRV